MNILNNFSCISLSLLLGVFAFILTCLGSGVVFLFKSVNKFVMDCMLGLSAGVMLAASFFSLIIPAISYTDNIYNNNFIILVFSFLIGSIFIYLFYEIIDKLIINNKTNFDNKNWLLFLSILLHNIPEGLIIGVACGSVYHNSSSLLSALLLTLGIAIQNFPEGAAISLPLKRNGLSSFKAFIFGVVSGIVEPIFAIIGAILVLKIQSILPLIMLFTAGAMIYVIIFELIPESKKNENEGLIAFINIIGFSFMMFLELLFG